ncbi:MAG: BtpA/SgcQ family protein [Candidatus Paceibacterota bacterium]|jgi:hypothetical protein
MSTFKKMFYPVIHCIDTRDERAINHALENARIAKEFGADGVFLIGHEICYSFLIDIYEGVRSQAPDLWIGINFLDISYEENWNRISRVAGGCTKLNALWIDGMPKEKLFLSEKIQVFGGVAFKYMDPHLKGENLKTACKEAMKIVDVITTSGDRTGSAPDILKLKSIKKYLGGKVPLALASGVNTDNVLSFIEYVDIFLVASSICESIPSRGEYLVPEKVRELARLIHV